MRPDGEVDIKFNLLGWHYRVSYCIQHWFLSLTAHMLLPCPTHLSYHRPLSSWALCQHWPKYWRSTWTKQSRSALHLSAPSWCPREGMSVKHRGEEMVMLNYVQRDEMKKDLENLHFFLVFALIFITSHKALFWNIIAAKPIFNIAISFSALKCARWGRLQTVVPFSVTAPLREEVENQLGWVCFLLGMYRTEAQMHPSSHPFGTICRALKSLLWCAEEDLQMIRVWPAWHNYFSHVTAAPVWAQNVQKNQVKVSYLIK